MRMLALIFTILLIAVIERERQNSTKASQTGKAPLQPKTRLQWLRQTKAYRFCVRWGERALILAAIGQAIVTFWGPFWPTQPEIQFHDTIDASSFVMPFKM